jgi:hypothetical protein
MSLNEILGEMNENAILSLFKNEDIDLIKNEYKYERIDFYYETDTYFFEIELKSRTTCKDKYPTTLLAKNKINYYINKKREKLYEKTPLFYIIFGFPSSGDKNAYEYFYIQYQSKIFKDFDKYKNPYENDKVYYLIPIELLKPIASLINILKYC